MQMGRPPRGSDDHVKWLSRLMRTVKDTFSLGDYVFLLSRPVSSRRHKNIVPN